MPQHSPPTVLAVLVVKDGARWLRACLASLARQTHPRLGILAVDNGSSDGSGEILERLLGPRRVLRLRGNLGFPGAVGRALRTRPAEQADFVLLVHDDAVLSPNAVASMLETARGEEGVGIVGGKVLDAEERRVLRDVGSTIDRFGYVYTPLEEGEIDQGQYDSVREVMAVSSAAMLVHGEAWTRAGPPDDRLRPSHADLDFCWRVRIAGYRVVLDPRAVIHHRAAGDRAERSGVRVERGRYYEERANLTALLKNYRLFTLLWVFPLFVAQGISKVALFLLLRRFADARQALAGWGWALLNVPGTIRRRFRVRSSRRVPDRDVGRLMVSVAERFRRWSGQVSGVLFPGRRTGTMLDEEQVEVPRFRARVGGLLADHPVATTLGVAVLLGAVAFRDVLFASPLEGGALPAFPDSARELLTRFAEGHVPGGLRGYSGPNPAVGLLGLGGVLTLGDPRILAWLLVASTPFLAGATAYRAVLRRTGRSAGAVVAGGCYAVSAVVMWAVSEGRVDAMVLLVGLPWLIERLTHPFDAPVEGSLRWVAGTGVGLAAVAAFSPAVVAPLAVVLGVAAVVGGEGGRRSRGLGLALAAMGIASLLAFPVVRDLVTLGGGMAAEIAPSTRFGATLRLSPGPAPGSWLPAVFLVAAGFLGFALAVRRGRRSAWRLLLVGSVSLPLAWLAGAGWLPSTTAHPVAFLGLSAAAFSALAGMAAGEVVGAGSHAFGARQLAYGALAVVVVGGVGLQVAGAVRGAWAVGRDRVSPAFPLVETAQPEVPFRVLWIGDLGAGALPAPGGPPEGVVEAGEASVRYALTGRHGRSVVSIGRPTGGRGYEHLERGLRAMLAGGVRHGGSLLAPFGVAYVVAGAGDLPEAARGGLDTQVDLISQEAGGLLIYRNVGAIPVAALLPNATAEGPARSGEVLAPARLARHGVRPLRRDGPAGWAGHADLDAPALVYVSREFDPRWRLLVEGRQEEPFPAFGWAVGLEAPAGEVELRAVRRGGWEGPVEVAALGMLWAVALWLAGRRRTV